MSTSTTINANINIPASPSEDTGKGGFLFASEMKALLALKSSTVWKCRELPLSRLGQPTNACCCKW